MENEAKTDLPLESDLEASMEGNSVKEIPNPPSQVPDFPEGGLRGWSVAIGCSGVLFSTFGYVNAFGYALYFAPCISLSNGIQCHARVLPNPHAQA